MRAGRGEGAGGTERGGDARAGSARGEAAPQPTAEELARQVEARLMVRLQGVERGRRGLRAMVLGLAVLVAVLMAGVAYLLVQMTTGAAMFSAERVTSREFVLAMPDGSVRGVWRVDEEGAARIVLHDRGGRERLRLSVLGEGGGAGISFIGEQHVPQIVLGYLPDGTSTLVFADAAGRGRAVLGVSGDAANLVFADRFGATRASVGVDAGGRPDFVVSDDGGQTLPAPAPGPEPEEVPDDPPR
jgi:hypothetical protein